MFTPDWISGFATGMLFSLALLVFIVVSASRGGRGTSVNVRYRIDRPAPPAPMRRAGIERPFERR